MSELLQDVVFLDSDDLAQTKAKLRVLQEEIARLARSFPLSIGETGVLDFGQVAYSGGFIQVTVNGVAGQIEVLPP